MQTFGWFAQFRTINASQHFLIFWVGPLLGGLLAGLTWRAFVVTKPGQQAANTIVVDKAAVRRDAQQAAVIKKAE